jgi:nicotinate-nucleotide pyrophosphorylase (carboxylating)
VEVLKKQFTWLNEYVQTKKNDLKIEVEARSFEDVKKVIAAGKGKVFRIMLDNFTPAQIVQALAIIKR